ncbi:MAG: hypothetical protein JWP02_3558 [Acidimicrobiales bacterium]|nr:hypothetical protein [Acidimicrobiales bacterium]
MKTIARASSSSTRRSPATRAVNGNGAQTDSEIDANLRTDGVDGNGLIIDATLEGIADAEKTVHALITRVRLVNESLFGDQSPSLIATSDVPPPAGRAYRANAFVASLRDSLRALSMEVLGIERL